MTPYNLYKIQFRQNEHDLKYHKDILSLGTQNRIKHLALHFAKYLGKLIYEENSKKTLSDIAICCLSLANALNIQLEITRKKQITVVKQKKEFIENYIRSISLIAKACESLDHLESYPSRNVLIEESNNIISLIISHLHSVGFTLNDIVEDRWKQIEKNYIFCPEKIHTISSIHAEEKMGKS